MAPRLLTQNADLRRVGVWNWTLPAWAVRLPDGRTMNVCPSAGACAKVCYARNGTYLFPAVRAAHMRNLMMVVDHLDEWTEIMLAETAHRRYAPRGIIREIPGIDPYALDPDARDWMLAGGAAVRIHDSGDFFSDDYLRAWLHIAENRPSILFYAYTKEVSRFRRVMPDLPPANFRWLYSMGGREDHLIDLARDRHADVYPDESAVMEAGYWSQDASDLIAALAPTTRIGIPANNIRHFNKTLAGRTFSQYQADTPRRKPTQTALTYPR
jgi:hypothetical protein